MENVYVFNHSQLKDSALTEPGAWDCVGGHNGLREQAQPPILANTPGGHDVPPILSSPLADTIDTGFYPHRRHLFLVSDTSGQSLLAEPATPPSVPSVWSRKEVGKNVLDGPWFREDDPDVTPTPIIKLFRERSEPEPSEPSEPAAKEPEFPDTIRQAAARVPLVAGEGSVYERFLTGLDLQVRLVTAEIKTAFLQSRGNHSETLEAQAQAAVDLESFNDDARAVAQRAQRLGAIILSNPLPTLGAVDYLLHADRLEDDTIKLELPPDGASLLEREVGLTKARAYGNWIIAGAQQQPMETVEEIPMPHTEAAVAEAAKAIEISKPNSVSERFQHALADLRPTAATPDLHYAGLEARNEGQALVAVLAMAPEITQPAVETLLYASTHQPRLGAAIMEPLKRGAYDMARRAQEYLRELRSKARVHQSAETLVAVVQEQTEAPATEETTDIQKLPIITPASVKKAKRFLSRMFPKHFSKTRATEDME